jgi:Domain of unknown function (DUF4340)
MNLKTTFLLILLAGAGAGGWYWLTTRKVEEPTSSTLTLFEQSLDPEKITRVEAVRGKETLYTLEKTGKDWVLPGKWPCRQQEADQLVELLCNLRSRYAPVAIDGDTDMKKHGLADDPLMIKITSGDKTLTLRFGEEPGETNRFTRPTFVRLDDQPELIRLGPGIAAALDRKLEYFQQRRLFPVERVARDEDGKEKIEQLDAVEVQVETGGAKFIIVKKDKDWRLKETQKKKDKMWEPTGSEDRLDPDRVNGLLRGFPDLWAEKFVDKKDKTLEDFGLKVPEYVLSVARPGWMKERKLLIGKVSETKKADNAPPPNPFGPPMPPPKAPVEYRFAMLEGNDQIFEVKADKLPDIAVPVDSLRDAHLARFKVGDVKRLEIRHGDQVLVLVKLTEKDKDGEKDKWRFEKPTRDDADAKQVEELLEKLAGLQARDKEILDNADLKTVGLEKPAARITITLEEGKKDKKDADKRDNINKRPIVFELGVKGQEKDKIYVRVDDWPRVNQVGGELLKLAERSELAYRPRELWHLERDAVTRITIEADGPAYHLERKDKTWKISPLDAEVAGKEIEDFAEALSHLRCERFEAIHVKDLAPFGLDKPAFKIGVTAKDGKPRTLQIGKSTDGGRFARLGDGDTVFVVNDKFLANVHKDAFALLDHNLLALDPADIQRIRFEGAAQFTLESKKDRWQVVDAPVPAFNVSFAQVASIAGPLGKLRAEKFVAYGPKIDWNQYGLAKPAAKITITVMAGLGDKGKDHVIELGKDAGMGGRFARIDGKDAVVVLDESVATLMQRKYVDFVDPKILSFDPDAVSRIDRQMKDAPLELIRREDSWQIAKPGIIRDADNLTVFDLLKRTAGLQAKRIAAYPAKDLKEFGLDQPAVVTLHLEDLGRSHVIKIGNLTKDAAHKETDERFAMIDDRPMVVVLSAELSRQLIAPAAFFADRNLVSFAGADRIELARGQRKIVFTRNEADWKMVEPAKADAQSAELDDLVRSVQRLRADEIVADKAADLKKYGLDLPAVQWRFKSGDAERLHLLIGAPENDKPGARRYAKLGDKAAIFLINGKLAAKAMEEYRSRKLWEPFKTAQAEEITISGPEKPYTITNKDGKWSVAGQPDSKVREPFLADTLGALAFLQPKYYVADANADLKAFGLEKPSWKIEVKAPGGKRELWLGALEPGSKLFYATVPASGAVFVVDALDSVVLARPLAELLVEEKKK